MPAKNLKEYSAKRRKAAKELGVCIDCKNKLNRKGVRCVSCNKNHRDKKILRSLSSEIEQKIVDEFRSPKNAW